MGITTNLTNAYNCFQRQLRDERILVRNGSITKSDVDGNLIKSPSIVALINVEIKRLIDGFRGVISSSTLVTTAKLFFNSFNTTPEWQKSSNWMVRLIYQIFKDDVITTFIKLITKIYSKNYSIGLQKLPTASKLCCLCAKEFSFKRKSRHCRYD